MKEQRERESREYEDDAADERAVIRAIELRRWRVIRTTASVASRAESRFNLSS